MKLAWPVKAKQRRFYSITDVQVCAAALIVGKMHGPGHKKKKTTMIMYKVQGGFNGETKIADY